MSRVKSSPATHRRKKKVLQQAKGYRGGRSKLYRTARVAVMRSMAYSYRDRKKRKGTFRRLWIARISAALRREGVSYSVFFGSLNKAGIALNRKILAELAVKEPTLFSRIVAQVKED
jgi:large subunit ribosomal protein L20